MKRLIQEAGRRGIKLLFGMGLFSSGSDQIIRADPAVRGRNPAGQPLDHVMCGATEKAWSYVEKILEHRLVPLRFGGVISSRRSSAGAIARTAARSTARSVIMFV